MTEDAVLCRAARYAQSGAEGLPALRRALDLLLREAPPRSCFRLLPCRAGERGARIGGCDIAGEALARALQGCGTAALICATLGQAADRLLARAQVQDMAWALMLDACASALVEEAAGLCRGAATAPGYAGFPLGGQQALLDLIDARRRLGVAGTGAGMLVPAKSLLYVQGLRPPGAGRADAPDPAPPCKTCARRDCPFRREKNNDESEEERC